MRPHSFLKNYGLSLILLASLPACNSKKEEPTPQTSDEATLVGRWELTRTIGGLAGGVRLADPSRKEEIIFSAAGQASFLLNGTVNSTLPYSLAQGTSYITRQPQTFVYYGTTRTSLNMYIEQLSATKLVLAEDAADGQGREYIKR